MDTSLKTNKTKNRPYATFLDDGCRFKYYTCVSYLPQTTQKILNQFLFTICIGLIDLENSATSLSVQQNNNYDMIQTALRLIGLRQVIA